MSHDDDATGMLAIVGHSAAFIGMRGILGDEKNGGDPTQMNPIGFTADSAMTPTMVLFRPMPPEKGCTTRDHWNIVDTINGRS